MTAEEVVEDFLCSYKEWITAGAPVDKPYCRGNDLEGNMYFALTKLLDKNDPLIVASTKLFRDLYRSHGLDPFFPFNKSVHDWIDETNAELFHQNKQMLNWLNKLELPQ